MRWALVLIAFVETLLGVLSVANAEDTALGEMKNLLNKRSRAIGRSMFAGVMACCSPPLCRHTTKRSTYGINPRPSFRK